MINGNSCIAILTLREESKRLPGKNFRLILDKPMCQWVLDECDKSIYIDDIYISTSSQLYREELLGLGYKIINRPKELDADDVTTLPILQHAIDVINCNDGDYAIWVDASKPMTKSWIIDKVIETAAINNCDSVFTLKRFNGYLQDDDAVVSQKLKPKYQMFGAVRLRTVACLISADPASWGIGVNHKNVLVNDYEIDVNTMTDLICAEALLKAGY